MYKILQEDGLIDDENIDCSTNATMTYPEN